MHCSEELHTLPNFSHVDQDQIHFGVAHLFVFPPNQENISIIQGHFVDVNRKKAYGIVCVDISSTKMPSCCNSESSTYLVRIYNMESGKSIKFEAISNTGDSITLESHHVDFHTQNIISGQKVIEHARILIKKTLDEIGEDLFVDSVIECVGEMKIYNADLDIITEDIDERNLQ